MDATVDGTGASASFRTMGGVTVVGGFAYVGTFGSIRKVNLSSGVVSTLAGHPTATGCTDSGDPGTVRFNNILDVATDGQFIYATGGCGYNFALRRTSIATGATTTLVSGPTNLGYLTVGSDGMIYTTGGQGIERIDPSTGQLVSFAWLSGNTYAIASDATYLWVVWVPSSGPPTIERFDLQGNHVPLVAANGIGIRALESAGDSLYGTGDGNRIRLYAKSDGSHDTLAGVNPGGYLDGTGTDAWFSDIKGLAFADGAVWIADNLNRRLRKGVEDDPLPSSQPASVSENLGINPGAVTTFAGNGTNATVDGTGTGASFRDMGGVVVVGGDAYVGTTGAIRKVDLDTGAVTTLAGHATLTGCVDSADPAQVRFQGVTDIDSDGHYLYTAGGCGNYGTTLLRRTSLATGATSTVSSGINQHTYITVGPDGMIYSTGRDQGIYRTDPMEATTATFDWTVNRNWAVTSDSTHLYVSWTPKSGGGGPRIERYRIDDGTHVTFASYDSPGIVALESAGAFLYGLSNDFNKLRVYDKATGAWINIAGAAAGWQDGTGTGAKFNYIVGIASDGSSLWVNDGFNYRLRKVVQGKKLDELLGACGKGDVVTSQCHLASDPVNTATGNFYREETDATLPGIGVPFAFTRYYNSLDPTSGPLGPGWSHTYNATLSFPPGGNVVFRAEDGKKIIFALQPSGSYYSGPGVHASLSVVPGGYALTTKSQITYRFDTQGRLTSIKDRNGRGPSLSYDGQSQLSTITDSVGPLITLTYSSGLLGSMSLPDGRSVQYGYAAGRLSSVTDLRGKVTTFTYDGAGRLATVVDPNNHTVVENTYGTDGRVATQRDALGNLGTFAWDSATETSTYTDAHGKTWTDDYDNGQLVRQVDPLGNVTKFDYSGVDRTSVTDPRGNVTKMTYDGRGNTLTRKAPAPLSYLETFAYDAQNNLTSYTDGRGNPTSYQYDAAGNLIGITEPGSVVTQIGRDPSGTGLPTSITDPRGKTISFGYDAKGNLTSVTTPLGNVTTAGYDPLGRMTSLVEPRGNVAGANPADYRWTYTYDAGNNLLSETDPLGNRTEWTYDPAGNLSAVKDAKLRITSYGYNAADELSSVTVPDATVTSYAYDEVGNLIRRTDAKNHVTTYGYDQARRLTSVLSPIGQRWTSEYDPAGSITKAITARGNATPDPGDGIITYAYDVLGRLTAIDYSDSTADVSFAYDANGNRTQTTDGAGTETYTYDALNRLTLVTRGLDSFNYGYDPADNVTRRTYPDGTVVDYAFDDEGRMASVSSGGATTSYGYDPSGNLLTTTLPPANGHMETRTYDRAGRLTDVKNAEGPQVLSQFTYTLDPVGNPTQVFTPGGSTTYAYDSLDRLTEVCNQAACPGPSDPFIRYDYDPVGNRITETRPAGTATYTYNDADQLTQASGPGGAITYSYDQDGNQAGAGSRTFAYDLANRMTSTTQGSTTITFAYDGDSRRLESSSGPAAQDETRYLWDPNHPLYQLALERDGAGALRRRYVHGIDLVSMTTGGSDFFYHYDALGSVANLTSAAGVTQWSYAYEPFGSIRTQTDHTGTAPVNLMRFTGELLDDPTGLYHLRAREFDPAIGRFYAVDPVPPDIDAASESSYVYVSDQPTLLVDPAGLRGACPEPGYTDVNINLILIDGGWYRDACGDRHFYVGFGIGFPGLSVTQSPSAISCESSSFQGFLPWVGLGGGGGSGTQPGEVVSDYYWEGGIGTPGVGAFINWVIGCPEPG